jgi:hypothetical protein
MDTAEPIAPASCILGSLTKPVGSRPLRLVVLGLVLTAALVLRIWGTQFGLPYAYHVDEPTYVSAALNLGAGVIGKQPNPTGFSNMLFAEYALAFLVGRVTGVFATVSAFEQYYRSNVSPFLLLSRLTSAVLGTATVVAVYWLGKVSRSAVTGLVAASLLCVSFLHVRDSHFGVPDVAAVFFVVVSVAAAVASCKTKKPLLVLLSAMSAGLALTTKWSVVWVIVPLVVTVVLPIAGNNTQHNLFSVGKRFLLGGLGFAIGILLGGFQLLVEPAVYLQYAMREAQAGASGGFGIWRIDTVSGWTFYLKTLGYGVGLPMLLFSVLGLVRWIAKAVVSRDTSMWLVLAFPVLYFVAMGATRHYFARYALPLLPFVALFAAECLVWFYELVSGRDRRYGALAFSILLIAAIALPLAFSIRYGVLLTRPDTRTLAKGWIEDNLAAGSKIAVDWPYHSPPLATKENPIPSSRSYFDVTTIGETGLSEHSIDWYRTQGFQYLVASSFIYDIPLVFEDADKIRRQFYDSLSHELELVKTISPTTDHKDPPFIFDEIYGPAISVWDRERPGPTLRVYKVSE